MKKLFFILGAVLMLASCNDGEMGNDKEKKEVFIQKQLGTEEILLGENFKLYEDITIKKISLLKKDGKYQLKFNFENNGGIKKISQYNLKIHATPLDNGNNARKYFNWNTSCKNLIEEGNEYYLIKNINPELKKYKLNIALYKTEEMPNGEKKWPNFGNQIYLNLNI